ncbi:MAG: S-adenosylmethionine decarboxylase family protein, partial [Alphaproteobacteria bacterium]
LAGVEPRAAGPADAPAPAPHVFGYHLILDCKACPIDKVTARDNIDAFIKALVPAIGMKAYGEPIIEHFAEHVPEAAGYSLVQLVETSSITGHFVDLNGDAYLDIFSCKAFDPEVAKRVVREFFRPQGIRFQHLMRQA